MKENVKIKFKTKERKMLREMRKTRSVFDLSSAFQIEPRTIKRWLKGENIPPYSARVMIARMYEEYRK